MYFALYFTIKKYLILVVALQFVVQTLCNLFYSMLLFIRPTIKI